MKSNFQERGAGILLVGIFNPFVVSAAEIVQSEKENISDLVANQPSKIFDTIYVYYGYGGSGERSFHPIYNRCDTSQNL